MLTFLTKTGQIWQQLTDIMLRYFLFLSFGNDQYLEKQQHWPDTTSMGSITLRKYVSKSIANAIRKAVQLNKMRILREIQETRGLYAIIVRWRAGEKLSEAEKKFARNQMMDIAKAIPALAIFILPFGGIVLFFMIKITPLQILPGAFYDIRPEDVPADDKEKQDDFPLTMLENGEV